MFQKILRKPKPVRVSALDASGNIPMEVAYAVVSFSEFSGVAGTENESSSSPTAPIAMIENVALCASTPTAIRTVYPPQKRYREMGNILTSDYKESNGLPANTCGWLAHAGRLEIRQQSGHLKPLSQNDRHTLYT